MSPPKAVHKIHSHKMHQNQNYCLQPWQLPWNTCSAKGHIPFLCSALKSASLMRTSEYFGQDFSKSGLSILICPTFWIIFLHFKERILQVPTPHENQASFPKYSISQHIYPAQVLSHTLGEIAKFQAIQLVSATEIKMLKLKRKHSSLLSIGQ